MIVHFIQSVLPVPMRIAYGGAAMAGGLRSRLAQRPVLIASAVALPGVLAGGWIGTKVLIRGVRLTCGAVRFGFALATFQLYRRCPDCRGVIRGDARVCRHCGYRG